MPKFDAEKDKMLWSKTLKDDKSELSIGVYSYNEGEPKLQINRKIADANGNLRFAKTGRLSWEEWSWIFGLAEEIEEIFQKHLDGEFKWKKAQ